MRHVALFFILVAFAAEGMAQEETLFKFAGETSGFGGPVIKLTSVHGQSALMIGGRGGWIIDHRLVLGGGAYGVVNEIDAPPEALPFEGPLDIEFGYLGFEVEYILQPMNMVHLSLYTLLGGGATNFVKDVGPVSRSNQQAGETAFMFVIEPAVNAEMNVTAWFRLNAGLSYRLTFGAEQAGLNDSDFCGMTATLTFKFGTF
ncbi:MAG: hypothetical protein V1799_12765 [bacterium]